MSKLILTTYDWVPEMPRGLVRDLRVRWALEEAGLAYRVESTPSSKAARSCCISLKRARHSCPRIAGAGPK